MDSVERVWAHNLWFHRQSAQQPFHFGQKDPTFWLGCRCSTKTIQEYCNPRSIVQRSHKFQNQGSFFSRLLNTWRFEFFTSTGGGLYHEAGTIAAQPRLRIRKAETPSRMMHFEQNKQVSNRVPNQKRKRSRQRHVLSTHNERFQKNTSQKKSCFGQP